MLFSVLTVINSNQRRFIFLFTVLLLLFCPFWFIVYLFSPVLQEDIKNDVITIPYIHQCECEFQTHFTSCLYAYKGLLLIFGLFLAWETRNVTVTALNDSKFIGNFLVTHS